MICTSRNHAFAAAALGAAALLAGACGGGDEASGGGDVTAAAIVPGADFTARIDMEAIRATPACADFAKVDDDGDDEAGGAGEGETPPLEVETFLKITGLAADDALAVLISGDLDELDFATEQAADDTAHDLAKAKGVLAIRLAKPVSGAKLAEALKASARGATVSELSIAGSPAVQLEPSDTDEPTVYAASGPGERVIFLAPNQASLEGALNRASSGQHAALPPALTSVQQVLSASAQASVAFVAPQKLRDAVKEQLAKAKEDPSAAMTAGLMEPFKELQSLALSVECGEELKVDLAGNLGDAQASSQLAGMLQAMALPMLKGSLAETLNKTPAELDDRFAVSSEGPALRIGVKMTAGDMAALRARREQAAGGASAPE